MSTVIGIDLGTTNSCVAILRDGRAEVLKNVEGDLTTPSVVGFDEKTNEFIVGKIAENREEQFAENTIRAVKRLMGKSYQQVIDEKIHEGLAYKVAADENGRACVEIQDKKHPPEEISAAILAYLKKAVEEQLEEKITEAVVTVPAYFDETQRQATINAGAIAGLEVKKIINEPAAAALAYAHASSHKMTKPETIVIYDLGGGTFDITLARIETDQEFSENYVDISVLSHDGNNHLGGVDIDYELVKLFKNQFSTAHGLALEDILSEEELARVNSKFRTKAEAAKKALSKRKVVEVIMVPVCIHNGMALELNFELTRERLESLTQSLVDKTLVCCQKALDVANINVNQVDHLFLVGGMVRMPLVQQTVEQFFGKKPRKILNPDEVVAMGAAVAHSILKEEKTTINDTITTLQVNDVTAKDLGISINESGDMSVIIERGSNLPCSNTRSDYTTSYNNQTAVNIEIFQGNEPKTKSNTLLGKFELQGIPPMPEGKPHIEVTFDLDENNILTVSAKEMSSGKLEKLEVSTPIEKLSSEKIDNLKKTLKIRE